MDRNQELQRELQQRDEQIKRLRDELTQCYSVEKVIVAAGLLPSEKFEQAREIVQGWKP